MSDAESSRGLKGRQETAEPQIPAGAPARPVKIGMISLGCAKNLVDAEVMLGDAVRRGMSVTADADEADVLVVNTCAFIDSAKEESIDAISTPTSSAAWEEAGAEAHRQRLHGPALFHRTRRAVAGS